jgi:hypothetical protein
VCALPAQAREAPPISHSSGAPSAAPEADSAPAGFANVGSAKYDHRGFHMRLELGGGYRSLSTDVEGKPMRVNGGGGGCALLVGGTPLPNLILVGELSFYDIIKPTMRWGDQSVDAKDASATVIGFGPGIVYYLMPANVSLGATLLVTQFSMKLNGQKVAESDVGFGGALRVAKEWKVAKHGEIGFGGQFSLASIKDKGENPPTWLASAFTLGASVTVY